MMQSKKLKQKQKHSDHTLTFDAIGTSWEIHLPALSPKKRSDLSLTIAGRIEAFDKTYSRFRSDSLISQIARKKGVYIFPNDFPPLIAFYKILYDLTGGTVTPMIGDLLKSTGYDAEYSLTPKKPAETPTWNETIAYDGLCTLTVKKPVTLDFGAAGKGYLIDLLSNLLDTEGISSYCIDAGGDIRVKNYPLRVGLEHPSDTKQVIGIAQIEDQSICGSATNRRRWGNFHHILHPFTKKPVEDIIAVWTTAETAMIADGLATALFFVKPEILLTAFRFDYVVVYNNYTYTKSDTFPGELFQRNT